MKKLLILLMAMLMMTSVFAAPNMYGIDKAQVEASDNATFAQKQELQQNWNRIRERHQERFQYCQENCTITVESDDETPENTIVTTREEVQVLFWSLVAEEVVTFDEEGNIIIDRANLWRWLQDMGWVE